MAIARWVEMVDLLYQRCPPPWRASHSVPTWWCCPSADWWRGRSDLKHPLCDKSTSQQTRGPNCPVTGSPTLLYSRLRTAELEAGRWLEWEQVTGFGLVSPRASDWLSLLILYKLCIINIKSVNNQCCNLTYVSSSNLWVRPSVWWMWILPYI